MPKRLANELALYEPDIINFSESPDESVVKGIADRLGMKYVYFPSGRIETAVSRGIPAEHRR